MDTDVSTESTAGLMVVADDTGLETYRVADQNGAGLEAVSTGRASSWPEGRVGSPTISPDSQQIVAMVLANDQTDLYLSNVDGTELRPLTDDPLTSDTGPSWSPKGALVAFERTGKSGKTAIWVIDVSTGDERELISSPGDVVAGPTWSPDGDQIYYFRRLGVSGDSDIFVYDMSLETSRRVTSTADVNESLPAVSPDSKFIAYVAADPELDAERGGGEDLAAAHAFRSIVITPLDGEVGETTRLTVPATGWKPVWFSADQLAFSVTGYPESQIKIVDLQEPNVSRTLTSGRGLLTFYWRAES